MMLVFLLGYRILPSYWLRSASIAANMENKYHVSQALQVVFAGEQIEVTRVNAKIIYQI